MILNPFKCEDCKRELQPENLKIGFDDGELIRICGFCGHEVKITYPKKDVNVGSDE